jgi:molybdate transport system substrate-binding protein
MLIRSLARTSALVLSLACCFAACSRDSAIAPAAAPTARAELTVYAATSTRDAFQALELEYERTHAVDLVFNFGSSGDLAKQIVAAAKADVLLSAGEKEMDETAELLLAGTRRSLLSNQLVVIEPTATTSIFTSPFEPAQLAGPELEHLSLANVETVPAGRYAKAWLERVGVWSSVAERVVPGVDVRAALAAVESGAARAGIVYRTDAAQAKRARVVFTVPLEEGPKVSYPIALIANRPNEAAARAFLAYVESPSGLEFFEKAGFLSLAAAERAK